MSVILVCWSCAQQGSPSGGPKDEDPPVVLKCEPPNYSTNFNAKRILITFDEFIVLDNVNQELIVSPPMEEKPEVKLKKKTLIIEFEETVRTNTTYTFNFGNAIKDLHEGNKLQNYEYVFSTGDVLDSLSVRGTLQYAESLEKPEDPVSIMLYSDLRDSVPLIDIPLYVGRTNDSGVFSVNNLRPDVYKVFALKDGNNNLLFDLPSEEIAFLDTSLILNADFTRQLLGDSIVSAVLTDTLEADSSGTGTDSLSRMGSDLNAIYIDLNLFTEEPDIQYLTDYVREDRRKIQLGFALPLTDTFTYYTLQAEGKRAPRFLEHFSTKRDSLTLWMIDSTDYNHDSIQMVVNYTVKDTLEQFICTSDTLLFTYRELQGRSKRDRSDQKETATEEEKLELLTIRNNSNHDLNRDLSLQLDFPLGRMNDSLISLYHIPDSAEVPIPFSVRADTLSLYRAILTATWESDSRYRMLLLPGAISSIYPMQHDTVDVSFKTRDLEFYGQILLTVNQVAHQVLVQLFSGKTLVKEILVEKDGQYHFPYLSPQKYQFKFIHDLNNNGKWDTGNYLKKIQPEPVELLPGTIEVRSNWDHDVTMILEK
ncbi:MAG: Ig-like domain-containing protein [Bacteroidales bacterium]|nr:Ig-like domain-containing protein [Bacteroidales bacterium]